MRRGPSIFAAGFVLAQPAAAAPPLLSNGPSLSDAQETANRDVTLAFRTAVRLGAPQAIQSRLATDLRNHDARQPSGAAAYAAYLAAPDPSDPDAASLRTTPLAVITDGALTMVATAGPVGFTSILAEIGHGRIMQMWYSGPIPPDLNHPSATPLPPPASSSPTLSDYTADRARRDADKALAMDFFTSFFGRGEAAAAARDLSPALRSHIPGVPSGPGFALVARKHQDRVTGADVATPLFLLAQGDLVAIGFPVPRAGDPGGGYAQNLLRVQDGRIVDWWFSGNPAGGPGVSWVKPAR